MIWASLRSKLTLTFAVVAVALVGLAGSAVIELRALEAQISAERTTTAIFDLMREVRDKEHRFFLFRKGRDFTELLEQIERTEAFVVGYAATVSPPEGSRQIAGIRQGIDRYRGRVLEYWNSDRRHPARLEAAEDEIRARRVALVETAEALSRTSQNAVAHGLAEHRRNLATLIALLVFLMFAVGHFLTRRIVRPLKSIENQMEQVAKGKIDRVEFSWQDRELTSLASAFNHVISELESRQSRALQTEKLAALGTMLSGVAHELNNPLSNISTTVQILDEELQHLSPDEMRPLMQSIDQQTERARSIVRTILEYARTDQEQTAEENVRALIERALESVRQGRLPPRAIMVDCPPELHVEARAEHLQRALINLLENAIDATDGDQPIVLSARAVTRNDGQGGVEFAVQDCGKGMTPAQRARMFDPFYTTKPAGQGTGLGLFITHEIVKQHGGVIDVISNPLAGTTVSFCIPATDRPRP